MTISFSRESSQLRDWAWVFCISGKFFTILATKEPQLFWVGPNQNTATTVFIIILLVICQLKNENKTSTHTQNQYNIVNQLYFNTNFKK